MSYDKAVIGLALAVALVPGAASAFTGVGGCSSLPEYYRALGALQGGMESACDMTAAQARRVLSTYGAVLGGSADATPRVRRHHVSPRASAPASAN